MGNDTKSDNRLIEDRIFEKTGMLIEALPFMRRYSDQTLVIKFGGHAMGEADYVNAFAADICTSGCCSGTGCHATRAGAAQADTA